MRDVVREALISASNADRVIVVAHSQGAAISAYAALTESVSSSEEVGSTSKVSHLISVGGATRLLLDFRWPGTNPTGYSPVDVWAKRESLRWTNIWASSDPVPAGPVGKTAADIRRRWNELSASSITVSNAWYSRAIQRFHPEGDRSKVWLNIPIPGLFLPRPRKGTRNRDLYDEAQAQLDGLLEGAIADYHDAQTTEGPEEIMVHNRGSLITDHIRYPANIIQVIDPILGIIVPQLVPAVDLLSKRRPGLRHTRSVRVLGLSQLLAVILAIAVTPRLLSLVPGVESIAEGLMVLVADNGVLRAGIDLITQAGIWTAVLLVFAWVVVYGVIAAALTGAWKLYVSTFTWEWSRGRAVLAALPWFMLVFSVSLFACWFGYLVVGQWIAGPGSGLSRTCNWSCSSDSFQPSLPLACWCHSSTVVTICP